MMHYPLIKKRIFIAGHRGMVGSAIVRQLASHDCTIVTAGREQVDLCNQQQTEQFVKDNNLDAIIIAAARVGGILANSQSPASFIYDNLAIATNVIQAAHLANVNRVLFLGSSCIYPKFAQQPIVEEALLTGPLEPTNEWYAIAKIAGIKLCQAYCLQYGRDYISAMPTNLYGIGDNFDLNTSHVLPALIRKAHDAKINRSSSFNIWGTGSALREFLFADDCADACIHLLQHYSGVSPINIGSGSEVSILELARIVADVVGFDGAIERDQTKPDGTPRKLMNSARLNGLGWHPKTSLRDGIAQTYEWYLSNSELRSE